MSRAARALVCLPVLVGAVLIGQASAMAQYTCFDEQGKEYLCEPTATTQPTPTTSPPPPTVTTQPPPPVTTTTRPTTTTTRRPRTTTTQPPPPTTEVPPTTPAEVAPEPTTTTTTTAVAVLGALVEAEPDEFDAAPSTGLILGLVLLGGIVVAIGYFVYVVAFSRR